MNSSARFATILTGSADARSDPSPPKSPTATLRVTVPAAPPDPTWATEAPPSNRLTVRRGPAFVVHTPCRTSLAWNVTTLPGARVRLARFSVWLCGLASSMSSSM